MSTMPESLNAIRLAIENHLETKAIPLQSRNRKITPVVGQSWARMSTLSANSSSPYLGTKWIRDRGIVVISLFFQLGHGIAESDKISYELRDTFSEWQYNYFETGAGSVEEVPTTLDFYHVNVNLPYRHK